MRICAADIERVIEAARAQAIPNDQRVLHILPQDFILTGRKGTRTNRDERGRLEAKVHIITGALSAAQNIDKCIRAAGWRLMT
ncbi:MAG: hypothetical protein Ct9H300mP14_06430 [Gammaproteobacteria bacterium]|nr:MAG: hypothetical protein Ct9H300mP14_06430 [Gammaproteobacteria bacterium]